MRRVAPIFTLALALAAVATAAVDPEPARPTPPAATMPAEPTLYRLGAGDGPTFDANVVHLLSGAADESNGLILPSGGAAVPQSFEVHASVRLDAGGEGFGLLLMDAAAATPDADAPAIEAWDEPNRARAIGIGFDGRNPPTGSAGAAAAPRAPGADSADAEGNVYDRPQRECSVHVDGREIFNRQSADFATGEPVPIDVAMRFVPGGALLSVRVAGTTVYADELLAGVTPFAPRVAIGARAGDAPRGTKLDVRDVRLAPGPALAAAFAPARHLALFDKVNVGAASREPSTTVDLGEVARGAARVIATLRIDAPAGGMDKLDRRGALYCYAADGQRYELFRFRTPGGKPWQWSVDVTDFLPLFRGQEAKFGLFIDTWRSGFTASVALDFYPGQTDRTPVAVVNLWQGEPILGDPARPLTAFFDTRAVAVPPGATAGRVRLSVTGHGRSPNTRNAAEFLQIERTLWANGIPFTNTLWKKDNYLNPCRPQVGAWRIDRAGWGPGSITEPWTIDVSDLLGTGGVRTLKLDYALNETYVNEHVGRGDPPTHWVDGQVIFYAPP